MVELEEEMGGGGSFLSSGTSKNKNHLGARICPRFCNCGGQIGTGIHDLNREVSFYMVVLIRDVPLLARHL